MAQWDFGDYGAVGLKRLYGNQKAIDAWKSTAMAYGIQPMLQFNPSDKANATDFAITIDAMDLLHSRCFGGFCLVTSDADFMPLAHRIQQDGIPVYNCGEVEKTKTSSKAYTAFISIESLLPRASKTNISAKTQPKLKKAAKALTVKKPKPTKAVLARVVKIITDAGGKTEKVSMVSLGQQLKKGYPEFDLKNYPHASLSKFLAAYPSHFEMADGGFVTLK